MSRIILFLLAASLSVLATAEEVKQSYNRFHMSASATGKIGKDTMTAILNTQEQGQNSAEAADKVNRRINWGIEQTKQSGVKVETHTYNTYPVYYKNKITGWRVNQSIRIEGTDTESLSQLLSTLQEQLNLQQVSFIVSPAKRQEMENALIVDAIAAFTARAEIVTKALGFQDYRIVNLHIGQTGALPSFRTAAPMRMEAMAADVAAPRLEAEEAELSISVSGEIEGY